MLKKDIFKIYQSPSKEFTSIGAAAGSSVFTTS